MARTISLEKWAQDEFGAEAPSLRTLRHYAKGKMTVPPAVKMGRKWFIDSEARFVGMITAPKISPNANPKLKRIIDDGCTTPNT
ncbi:excisionase [Plesiomonas sp.]|uniref:excisionase n=1 Tax=Plesiomonas sp. TaxID=2486279 RepID=UPI003F2C0D50